jgi:hypothetical protein
MLLIPVIQRFSREALPWRQLRNIRILPFLGIDTDTHSPFVCMVSPWMDEGSILEYIQRMGRNNIQVDYLRLVSWPR